MQIIFDTYRRNAKDFAYCKVIDDDHSEAMKEAMLTTSTNNIWELKKERRRAACEKIIFEYCILTDKCCELYRMDSGLELRWLHNIGLMELLSRDMIFVIADIFCQTISYQDACILIDANNSDTYDTLQEWDGRIPHSETYRRTERLGQSAIDFFEIREAEQQKTFNSPRFDSNVLLAWNKSTRTEKRIVYECEQITWSHLQMIREVLNDGAVEKYDLQIIDDICRKMVMAIAAEYSVAIPDDVIEKIITLEGVALSEEEENQILIKAAIIGKEATNYCIGRK